MKWTTLYSAVVAMIGMVGTANAGSIVLTSGSCCGAEKGAVGAPPPLVSPNAAGL